MKWANRLLAVVAVMSSATAVFFAWTLWSMGLHDLGIAWGLYYLAISAACWFMRYFNLRYDRETGQVKIVWGLDK